MSRNLQCGLFVSCVCLAFAHNDLDDKVLALDDKDVRKDNRWTWTNPGFATDLRHLNEHTETHGDHRIEGNDKYNRSSNRSHNQSGNHRFADKGKDHRSEEKHGDRRFEGNDKYSRSSNRSHDKSGIHQLKDNDKDHRSEEKSGDDRFEGNDKYNRSSNRSHNKSGNYHFRDNDKDHRSEEKHGDHKFEGNDKYNRSSNRSYGKYWDKDHRPDEERGDHHGEGHMADDIRSKNSSGGHLRGHNDPEGTRESMAKDDGFGLPIIIASVGAALIVGFALAGILVLCWRRSISTKSSVVENGVVVVGQPVTNSVHQDESNAHGNSANTVSK